MTAAMEAGPSSAGPPCPGPRETAAGLQVAVTGASGFIGRRVLAALQARGHGLRALSHRSPPVAGPMETVSGGLSDGAALDRLVAGADAVVHLAGIVAAPRRQDFEAVNTAGTDRLAACAEAAGVPRFLYVSSLAARVPELSPYAASKAAAEACLARRPALAYDVLRPPAVYGPGDRQVLIILQLLKAGIALLAAPPSARVALIHVDDLAEAIRAWVEQSIPQRAFYEVADPRPDGYTWNELLDAAAQELAVRPRIRLRPSRALLAAVGTASELGARALGRSPFLTRGKLRELRHPDWRANPAPFCRATGWRPRIGLQDGLAGTVGWYRAHGWL